MSDIYEVEKREAEDYLNKYADINTESCSHINNLLNELKKRDTLIGAIEHYVYAEGTCKELEFQANEYFKDGNDGI